MKKLSSLLMLIATTSVAFANQWIQLLPYSQQSNSFTYSQVTTNPGEVVEVFSEFWRFDIDRTLQVKAVWGDTNNAPNWYTELATLVLPATTTTRGLHEDGFMSVSEPTIWWSYWTTNSIQGFQEYDNSAPPAPLSNFAYREGWVRTSITFSPVGYGY